MKDYIKLLMFFALLALMAYIGSQNLSNTLLVLLGMFVGFTVFFLLARKGWLDIKIKEGR
ncbi:hypothetical protein [Enterococcus wangshanyuanii]|uniref:Uncharacterized protein n=1 Tax=Enterococcus wangshanyuanii TaxID=2005703 RepID=A0ABQ1PS82_9ENTE|nr:hypothetical protein [Enterococcus wangshanyuanii]GGD02349.1 hypothetical protein GCM10011573_34720 [Enterococcus wangshanyuanii]